MPNDLSLLMTEQQNMNTLHIDEMDTIEILNTINQEDKNVALAVRNELVAISKAVDAIYKKVARGGRLIYIGAGTAGCFRMSTDLRSFTNAGAGYYCWRN